MGMPSTISELHVPRVRTRWHQAWPYAVTIGFGVFIFGMAHGFAADGAKITRPQWIAADLLCGVAALVVLHWRHRFPVRVMLAVQLLAVPSTLAAGATCLAVGSMATRRRAWQAVLAVLFSAPMSLATNTFYEDGQTGPWWAGVLSAVLFTALIIASGWYVGARQDLVTSYRERIEAAENAQTLRVEQALSAERTAIAREMHDVLAHRISLIAMHAGALAYRTDLSAEQTRQAASLIQSTATQALDELRGVLGVLRAAEGSVGVVESEHRPQPSIADIHDLVADAVASGSRVVLDDRVSGRAEVPLDVGRHGYRLVQEALTNARKHAPGAPVEVVVDGRPGGEVTIEVTNPSAYVIGALVPPPVVPGSGLGLIGLAERAHLAGGSLAYGSTPDGGFRVYGRFPWPIAMSGEVA